MGITAEPMPQGKKSIVCGVAKSWARLRDSFSMQEKHSRKCLIQSQTLIGALSNYSCCYYYLNCICIASTMFFLALLLIWSDLEGRASGNRRDVPKTHHSLFLTSPLAVDSLLAICLNVLGWLKSSFRFFHNMLQK